MRILSRVLSVQDSARQVTPVPSAADGPPPGAVDSAVAQKLVSVVTACATVLGFVVPITLHPLAMPCVPLVVGLLLSLAVGSFHRRG